MHNSHKWIFICIKKKKNADDDIPNLTYLDENYCICLYGSLRIKWLNIFSLITWCMLFTVEDIYVTPSNNTLWKKKIIGMIIHLLKSEQAIKIYLWFNKVKK